MGLHLLQPTARKRITGDNGGPSETTLEPSSSVSPAPQHSTGGGRGRFPHGLQDLAFRSSPQEQAHFSCLISMDIISSPTSFAATRLTQLKDAAKDVVIFTFSSQEMVSPQGTAAMPHQITAPNRLSPTTAG